MTAEDGSINPEPHPYNAFPGCTEEEIANFASRGNRQAFGALFDANIDEVYGFMFRVEGTEDKAEVTSKELFDKVLVRLERNEYDGLMPFRTWLYMQAAQETMPNIAERAVERVNKLRGKEPELELTGNYRFLSRDERRIASLRFRQGFEVFEIASMLGVPGEDVSKVISTIRSKLTPRENLETWFD